MFEADAQALFVEMEGAFATMNDDARKLADVDRPDALHGLAGRPVVKGSYSFPAPGQIVRVGPTLWEGIDGRLQFAGEHCAYAFPGYMEGALHAGAAAARRVAERLGVTARVA